MKIVVLIGIILFVLIIFKIITGRNNFTKNKKSQNETTIDLEEDPKTKEYKPKE